MNASLPVSPIQRVATPLLVGATLLLAVFSATQGAFSMTSAGLWEAVGALTSGQDPLPVSAQVLWQIRLPRICLAVLVGAGLAGSGAGFQGLFRNPLASPTLLGVSAGASAGAALAIVMPWGPHGVARVPIAAFLGALISSTLVLQLGRVRGRTDTARVLLAGVALTSAASALVGVATLFADDAQLRSYTFWVLGSLGGASWSTVATVALGVTLGLGLVLSQARGLDAFALGQQIAQHLGLNVQRLTLLVLVGASLAVGSSVAASGMIGFVGLAVPHLVRMVLGPAHARLLPATLALGSLLLLAADTAARTLAAPTEIPIGILTTTLGVPFFIWLLRRKESQW